MDTKRFATGTLVGGVILYVAGFLIFDLAVAGFYAANAGSATGVARDPQLVWAVALGSLSYAALITLAIGTRAGSSNIGGASRPEPLLASSSGLPRTSSCMASRTCRT